MISMIGSDQQNRNSLKKETFEKIMKKYFFVNFQKMS